MMGTRRGRGSLAVRELVASAVLLLASGLLVLAFGRWSQALFPGYRHLSRAIVACQAQVASVVPFAIWDWLALVLAVVAILWLVRCVRRRRGLLAWLGTVALVASATLVVFVGGWALNHYAPPLADDLGLTVGRYSEDQLAQATEDYLATAVELAPQVPREADGTLSDQDFYDLARLAGSAYARLGERYDVYAGGSTAPVKSLLLWGEPLLYSGYVGIFWSPTGEAGVPLRCARLDMPYTMCHEAAHRLGIASEQEANFAAFMACDASDDVRLRYAGHYSAFAYCWNALYKVDPDRARAIAQDALASGDAGVQLVFADRAQTIDYYAQFQGEFQKVGDGVNNTYLKSFGESSGVRSYGLVADYLIAWDLR